MSRTRRYLVVAVASLAVALSACGSDDSSSDGWDPGEDAGAEGQADTGAEGSGGGGSGGGGSASDAGTGGDDGSWNIDDGGEADAGSAVAMCANAPGECAEVEPGRYECACGDAVTTAEAANCDEALAEACGGEGGTAATCEESGTTDDGCEWNEQCQKDEATKNYSCSCSFECPDGSAGGMAGAGSPASSCHAALDALDCGSQI